MSKFSAVIILIMINLIGISFSIADTFTQSDTVRAVDIVDDIPNVDGLLNDACWDEALWQSIDQVWINYGENIDSSDYSGRYKVLWSSETNLLYFIVEINDDIFVDGYQYDNDGYYNYDVVEVFIDQDKSGGLHVFDGSGSVGQEWGTNAENAFSYHINTDLLPNNDPNFNFTVCDIAGTDWGNMQIVNYADHFPQFAFRKSDGKYYWEFSLSVYDSTYDHNDPSASLVTLQTGDVMGLSLAYCDNDDPNEEPKERDNFFGSVWVPEERANDHWKNANDFGTLKLVKGKNPTNTTMTIGTNFWDQAWGGSDPWKNGYQNAISPDSVNNPAYNPWKLEFIREINFYSTLRFMDFARINNNHDEIFWNDRVKKEDINQGRMALEWMIDLCNRTNTDMWICLPELTVEDYWYNAAMLIKQQLNPNLKVYIEWSNETWNPQFSANQTAIDSGKVYDLWFPNDQGTSWGERRLAARYSTFNSIRIWEKFIEVFGSDSDSRVVKVLAGSAADDWWDAALVNALTDSKINPNNTLPDLFAIAPYVGAEFSGADPDILEKMSEGIISAEEEIINVRSVLEGTNQWSEQMPPHPAVSTLDMACYEGGQHILHQSASFAVNPGAYDWYINYLDMLSKYLSGPYMNYNHSGKWGDMAWGAKDHIGQPAVEAPKFMALHNWYIMHNKDNPGPEYLLTVNNGSGDGSYYSGMYVFINADKDSLNRIFDQWVGDTAYVADVKKENTVVTIEDKNITLTATYKIQGITTRFEAEDAELIGVDTASSRSGYSGSGYVNGATFDEDGDEIIFTVETENGGTFNLSIGYGGFYGGKYQYINVNGVRMAYFEFPETYDWTTIDYGIITLNQGANTISIEKSWGWMDVDFIELVGDGITGINNKTGMLIDKYKLFNNYPNPFNPDTNISYQIPYRSLVKLEIFDVLGREIRTLVNEEQNSGIYKVMWNGNNSSGTRVASGIYFIHLQAGEFSSVKKMTLLR